MLCIVMVGIVMVGIIKVCIVMLCIVVAIDTGRCYGSQDLKVSMTWTPSYAVHSVSTTSPQKGHILLAKN